MAPSISTLSTATPPSRTRACKFDKALKRSGTVKKHQQADGDNYINIFDKFVDLKVCNDSMHGECFRRGSLLDVANCGWAGIQCQDIRAALGGCKSKVAHAAPVI